MSDLLPEKCILDEIAGRSAQLAALLEGLEDAEAFDAASAAPPEDRETVTFDEAIELIELGR